MTDRIRQMFLQNLSEAVSRWKVIGFPIEHPKWYQYIGDWDNDDNNSRDRFVVRFKSSQCPVFFWFEIENLTDEEWHFLTDYDKAYSYFRSLKYKFLESINLK